ncbi:MAG TPA: nitroreductase/quinone reductase family protein [Actinoplanes sp.]|nr:nitroreductase/quinone reductase family protein [Actinoplanes sp.]
MRSRMYRVTVAAEKPSNLTIRFLLRRGIAPRMWALLETTGRKSGRPRQTPVGNGLVEGVFWIVASHGRQADYVRNIEKNPAVRVKIGRRWRTGTATLLDGDDTAARSRVLPHKVDAAIGRLMQTQPLTVRVDLD